MNELKGKEILDILLDENNDSQIVLVDCFGENVTFDQIMTIPYYNDYNGNTETYCILQPVSHSKEFMKNMVYPFLVKKVDKQYQLEAVEDKEIIKYIENKYNESFE